MSELQKFVHQEKWSSFFVQKSRGLYILSQVGISAKVLSRRRSTGSMEVGMQSTTIVRLRHIYYLFVFSESVFRVTKANYSARG